MTCSSASLDQPEVIIDEYVRQGFTEIFLRHISPYGFAVRSASRVGYETEKFLEFYKRGLAHILRLNREGIAFREVYTSLLLRRMLTAYPTAYVDLQSPAGAGLSALVYNYDGDVYASDEGRMLAEMGDTTFRLGNVHRNSWEDLFLESPILDILHRTMTEGLPNCSECAFQPWCGSDPVFHHATQGDLIGHRPTSAFCRRNMEVMRHLVRLLEDDSEAARILRRWIA
jgi:radical SAM protein with 4Fe4S-binding SPASM domain